MKVIELPYENLYICEICGKATPYEEGLKGCKERVSVEKTQLRVGSVVLLHHTVYDKGVVVGISTVPESWTVERIYYTEHHVPRMDMQFAPLPPHTLLFRLVRHTGPTGSVRAVKDLCARDLAMWQEGNRTKLCRAGLLNLPELNLKDRIKKLLKDS